MRQWRLWRVIGLLAGVISLASGIAFAQVRTTGQIVVSVKDSTGAVVPNAELVLVDLGTGNTLHGKSSADGGLVFPNLQPGTYSITATAQGFQAVTMQSVVVQTARVTDVVVLFQVAALSEVVQVEGRAPLVETSSSTLANTVRNAEIAKLPLAGRNILNFALLVPGTATSAGARDSEYNGLPGGAIAITLDGINNNSQRFRSGGTSFFVFAPVRLGAVEEVTVSTGGLTADSGAEGAVQIQFTTKRGSNTFRGQVFDTIIHEGLNANSAVNNARNIAKTKLRQHEYGFNLGGPVIRNKLFFFGNFEQVYAPSERTLTRNVLTPESQLGVFRYVAADNSVRTVNLLDIARGNGFQSSIDPFIAEQLRIVNDALGQGTTTPSTNLLLNTFSFRDELSPNANIYPTARVDYQVTPGLSTRGVLNLQWRDLPTQERFPGLPSVSEGFTSTYYILSGGADWAIRNNLFNQISVGGQSNFEEFRPGNELSIYDPQRLSQGLFRINLPLIDSPQISGDQMPIPRNNPVWNFSNTLTWLKGNHTLTFGGTFRRTTMYESIGGAPLTITLGVATGDPVSSIFNATTIPGVRATDLTTTLQLYSLLTGRISGVTGNYALDENTKQFGLNPAFRREAQNVGGLYVQDQWRLSPELTLNYGLRWELTGAATNPNEVYSSPSPEHLLGPSTAPFQPGTLNGVANPQVFLQPKPYQRDFVNPAPNVGVAWNPQPPGGWLGRLLGRAVYRGSFGMNYYDEGLINFQTAAGNGPGLLQSNTLTPGMPGFAPGGLTLRSTFPPFSVFPTSFAFPIDQSLFTFTRGFSAVDPDIQTPYVLNWTIGYQRELWRSAAIEVRYVGNRGRNLWRGYNLNETNIIENGFLQEFRNAQRNLEINVANGRAGFANTGLPGQASLPLFDAAFGPRGSQGAVAAASGYTNGTFITQLQQGQAGRLANSLAGNSLYLCRMVGSTLPACNTLGYNAQGPYPTNVFQPNPFAAGNAVSLLTDEASSKYDSLQLQFRQRYQGGLSVTANYTYGHARSDRFEVGASNFTNYRTLRDKTLEWGPTAYDLRHTFLSYWTYELPFGRERRVGIDNAVLDQILGGWALSSIIRLQTGRPFLLTSGRSTVNQNDAGVVLNGITVQELQKMVNVRPGPNGNVYVFDERLIGADGRAAQYLAPPTTPGELGQFVYLYGPGLMGADLAVAKTFRTGHGTTFNFEALMINALNRRNLVVGATGGATLSIDSTTFGQTTTAAIGARQVQFRLQVGF
jgi:Carboxypeptidase regulatory-like domain